MKKVLLSGMIVFSTMTVIQPIQNETQAARITKTNINYTSPSVVKKIKSGTLTFDGAKLGTKVSTLLKNKDFKYNKTNDAFHLRNSRDSLYMDLQEDLQLKQRKINRIEDEHPSVNQTFSRTKMLKSYGKPLVTKKIKSAISGSNTIYYIDFYKNVTFIYNYDSIHKSYLDEVHFKKYTNKSDFNKWQKLLVDKFYDISGFLWFYSSISYNDWDRY
ncbi:hypothetical protein MHJ97_12160 [Macrococcus epidermidis]|uniref:hypothetical protein n=1 Tax=Macrococcus epidermidis TaxID=1902580 RepID=UPI001EF3C01F|nr:hypothetical protein [Macrococcus epidermidis]MCG7421161.1 hypothetical protein [Macrococcus epidermidis]